MTTKLEELEAAWVACAAARDADIDAAREAADAAWAAYREELKKTQEENSDDH
jgi:ribosomal protein L12E/L44/L45/RPP1/RPP2